MNKIVKTVLKVLGYIIAALLGRSRRSRDDVKDEHESHKSYE